MGSDVSTIQERLAEARARRDELQAEAQAIQEVGPYSVDASQVPRTERLRRRAREPEVRSELLAAQAQVEDLEAELRDAKREAARSRQAEARRELVERLPEIHTAALRLAALVVEAWPHGEVADPEALRAFAPWVGHGTRGESLLVSVERYWHEAGLLEEEKERAA